MFSLKSKLFCYILIAVFFAIAYGLLASIDSAYSRGSGDANQRTQAAAIQNDGSDKSGSLSKSGSGCKEVAEHTFDCTDYSSINWEKYGYKAIVTKYSPQETCTARTCINAMGKRPIAEKSYACPRTIKLGTEVVIAMQIFTCDDRTAERYDGRFDGWTESHEEAVAWGKKELNVVVLQ